MDKVKFDSQTTNPFEELSELVLQINEKDDCYDILCRLTFGSMSYLHGDREYLVGVSRADFRIKMSGCEKSLDSIFGDYSQSSVSENINNVANCNINANVSMGVSPNETPKFNGSLSADSSNGISVTQQQVKNKLPVTYRPKDKWEIIAPSITNTTEIISGSPIKAERLCTVVRNQKANRMEVTGEVHVPRNSIIVKSKVGNRIGKTVDEFRNKDAVIELLLKKTILREASPNQNNRQQTIFTICKHELTEI